MFLMVSRSKFGAILHFMSFKFRSTELSASFAGSIYSPKLTCWAWSLPFRDLSQPVTLGISWMFSSSTEPISSGRITLLASCLFGPSISVTKNFDLCQPEALSDKNQVVAQGPTWPFGIGRGVNECNIAIFLGNLVEEALFELTQGAHFPMIRKGLRTIIIVALWISSVHLLGQKEAMLSPVYTVSPGSDSIDKRRTLIRSQMLGWSCSLPCRV